MEAGTGSLRRVRENFKPLAKAGLKGSRARTKGGKIKRIQSKTTRLLNKKGKAIPFREPKKLTLGETKARTASRKLQRNNKGSRVARTNAILRKARKRGAGR